MLYRLKLLKRQVALACMLACLSIAVVRAEEPAAAPADLVQVLDIRINKAEQSLKDFKAFLDNGAPVASAMVMGQLTPMLIHTNGLDGVDGQRPVHLLVFLPKKVFTSTVEQIEAMEPEPTIVQLLPLADAKVWTDKLGEEVDEIKKDGDFQTFKQPDLPGEVFLKIAGKFAVIGINKAAVDFGVSQADAVAAADAARKTTASAQIEFRPHDLFAATGLDKVENRKSSTQVIGVILQEMIKEMDRNAPVPMNAKLTDADIQQVADIIYSVGEQAESVQMNATFSKDAANIGYALEAVKDSDLAKVIAGMKALDVKLLSGLPKGAKIGAFGGTLEPIFVKLADKLVAKLPKDAREMVAPAIDLFKAAEGQTMVGYLGTDEGGRLQAAGELNFKAGTELAKQIKTMQDWMTKIAGDMKAQGGQIYNEYTFGETKDVDGWTYSNWTSNIKADDPVMQQQLAMSSMFLNNPQHTAVLIKGTRMVYATAGSPEAALAAAQDFAAHKTGLGLKADFQTWLEKDAKDRNAACEFLFDPFPLVKRAITMFVPKPEVAKLADQTIGTINPLQMAVYTKDTTVQAEIRIEAETVKQWTAFVMQMMMATQGGGPDAPGPDMVEPAPPGGDF